MAINKQDLVNVIVDVTGGTRVSAEATMEALIGAITDALKKGDQVTIAGLGIFEAKMRKARKARNPRTGEEVNVPAMRLPKFRAAKALKDAVK